MAIFVASLSGVAAGHEGVYRPGQPQVLAPQATGQREAAGVLALFEARYKSAGSPRIMVYWNRTLAPTLPETPSTSITVRERGDASLEASSSSSGDAAQARKGDLRWAEDYSTEVTLTGPAAPLPDTARGGLAEAFDFAVEAGMQQTLRDAGAVLVDRSAVLRLTRLDHTPDARSLEMLALSKYADLLLEFSSRTMLHRAPGGLTGSI